MSPSVRLIFTGRYELEVVNPADHALDGLRLYAGPELVPFLRGDECVSSVDVPPNTTRRIPVAMTPAAELRLKREAQVRWSVAGVLRSAPVHLEI